MLGTIGYCTNVHAGRGLEETQAQLAEHASRVKQAICPDSPMRLGLWFSGDTANELLFPGRLDQFKGWLRNHGLIPFTLNGFPYCDFHQPVVKHRVYEPDWRSADRREFTKNLGRILANLLPPGEASTISTLPLAWGQPGMSPGDWELCAANLAEVADELAKIEANSGHSISVAIEPEPGCAIQYSSDLVRFFKDYLLHGRDERTIRRHLRVCHDVCHAAVMREPQADVLAAYHSAGIQLGKIQVSSAVLARLDSGASRGETLAALAGMIESRYLHQTTALLRGETPASQFFEDLPPAIEFARREPAVKELRVHFHVPVYLRRFGALEAMPDEILECLSALPRYSECRQFEVETYAWDVLPRELQHSTLADGIAAELRWFQDALAAIPDTRGEARSD
jgi:sugar phosphate isomerase/epimerase